MALATLPTEILQLIWASVYEPDDIASFARSCRGVYVAAVGPKLKKHQALLTTRSVLRFGYPMGNNGLSSSPCHALRTLLENPRQASYVREIQLNCSTTGIIRFPDGVLNAPAQRHTSRETMLWCASKLALERKTFKDQFLTLRRAMSENGDGLRVFIDGILWLAAFTPCTHLRIIAPSHLMQADMSASVNSIIKSFEDCPASDGVPFARLHTVTMLHPKRYDESLLRSYDQHPQDLMGLFLTFHRMPAMRRMRGWNIDDRPDNRSYRLTDLRSRESRLSRQPFPEPSPSSLIYTTLDNLSEDAPIALQEVLFTQCAAKPAEIKELLSLIRTFCYDYDHSDATQPGRRLWTADYMMNTIASCVGTTLVNLSLTFPVVPQHDTRTTPTKTLHIFPCLQWLEAQACFFLGDFATPPM